VEALTLSKAKVLSENDFDFGEGAQQHRWMKTRTEKKELKDRVSLANESLCTGTGGIKIKTHPTID
jgi:hypothetical protein